VRLGRLVDVDDRELGLREVRRRVSIAVASVKPTPMVRS
jgi:hypothetical protein